MRAASIGLPGAGRRNKGAVVVLAAAAAFFWAVVTTPATAASYAEAARLYDGGQVRAAVAEYRELAEQGDAAAQVALAGLHAGGEVAGAPDHAVAARWYRRAAEQGDAVAQMNLGDLYARGLGVARDDVKAWVWLSRAARQGRDWAASRRDEIARRMSPAALAEARRRLEGGDGAASAMD